MRILAILAGLIVLVVILLLALPAPIDPVAWEPDPDPGLTGDFAENDRLASVQRLLEGEGNGPEDVACAADGTYFTGYHDGRIVRFTDDGKVTEVTNTGGRPLGMQFDESGRLIVADAMKGLLAVTMDGSIEVLSDSVNGQRMLFVDDLDIAADGTIWFSDASARHDYHHNILDFLEGRSSGRLLSYDPSRGITKVHMENLFFANGVALGPDDAYVLVNETGAGRIQRLWLKGQRAGETEPFVSGLPGVPDNLSFNGSDTFWVAMPALRSGIDVMASKPRLRKLLSHLPVKTLASSIERYSFVVGLDTQGKVVHNLQDTAAGFNNITSVNECNGSLYIGSLSMPAVARYPLP
tara:strand:- start:86958 stop:88013 length:1056 start_codon:yes stop_codon:yes gene_type:complete